MKKFIKKRILISSMKNWLKELIILASAFGFYIFSGDGSLAFFLLVILNYLEFLYPKKFKADY